MFRISPYNLIMFMSTDHDECKSGFHNCDTTISNCTNTNGSYRCDCHHGYINVANDKICAKRGKEQDDPVAYDSLFVVHRTHFEHCSKSQPLSSEVRSRLERPIRL